MTQFRTTRWSLIADACAEPARARPALGELCRDYRPPVLAYLRRHGHAPADAEDLAQEFFARFLERGWYAGASPERGRFRALLLTALRRFLLDMRDERSALKRGGHLRQVALGEDFTDDAPSPEQAFTQAWLGVVLERARGQLRPEWERSGRGARFERFWECIDGHLDSHEVDALAAELGLRRNTLAVQLHRMRARMRQLVRMELLATVGSREDLEVELGELRALLDAGTAMG